jgi:hypothetical protein
MMAHDIHLRSRHGEGYLVLTVLFLGFSVILMSLAIDGLGMAVTYRRAVGLASVGAHAGAGELADFNGAQPSLSGRACITALETLRASLRDPNSPQVIATCVQQGNSVLVAVTLKPLKFFGGPLSLPVERVTATARAAPAFGINEQE